MSSETISAMSNSCDPMDYTVHRILKVAVPLSRGSTQTRDWTQVSHVEGRFFTIWATREALIIMVRDFKTALFKKQ